MWMWLNAPENTVFAVAWLLMLLLGVLELLSLFVGDSGWLDGFLPDSLTEAAHPEIGVDAAEGGVVRFLSWLYVGKVPLLMLMVVFLAVFGICGFVLQQSAAALTGGYLKPILAVPAAWFLSLPATRSAAAVLYRIMPKDETTAISEADLLGRVGLVVTGVARKDSPAQVRVRDVHGQQHYVMAATDDDSELPQGTWVLLVSRQGSNYTAIANPNPHLQD